MRLLDVLVYIFLLSFLLSYIEQKVVVFYYYIIRYIMNLPKLPYTVLLEQYEINAKLYEGLITSYPKENLVMRIMSLQELPDVKLKVNHPKETLIDIIIYLNGYYDLNYIYQVLSEVETIYGWNISKIAITNTNKMLEYVKTLEGLLGKDATTLHTIEVIFEMKYPTQVINIPNVLYHVSPTQHSKKILRIGLVPKTKNNAYIYDDRIYFTDGSEYKLSLINILNETNPNRHWSIFEIDTRSFSLNGIKLYMDPMFGSSDLPFNSYFTRNNIPTSMIKIQGVVDLEKLNNL